MLRTTKGSEKNQQAVEAIPTASSKNGPVGPMIPKQHASGKEESSCSKGNCLFPLLVLVLGLMYMLDQQTYGSIDRAISQQQLPVAAQATFPRLSAKAIVDKAFNESYASLVACTNEKDALTRPCMAQLFEDSNTTFEHWWYRTLLRDCLFRPNGVFSAHHVLASRIKGTEVEMCTFGKVATTQWRKVFCQLDPESNSCKKRGPQWAVGGATKKSIYLQKNTPRFAFVRDPLERFLSAYLDKCYRRRQERHCEPNPVFTNDENGLTAGIKENKKELFSAYVDAMPLKWNMHFIPQSLFCGGVYREFHDYDFIGSFGDDFYDSLYNLGLRYGDRMMEVLEDVFDVSSKKGQMNNGTETSASTKVYQYYTPRTVRRVLEYLSIDYVAFDLDVPMWAQKMLEDE